MQEAPARPSVLRRWPLNEAVAWRGMAKCVGRLVYRLNRESNVMQGTSWVAFPGGALFGGDRVERA